MMVTAQDRDTRDDNDAGFSLGVDHYEFSVALTRHPKYMNEVNVIQVSLLMLIFRLNLVRIKNRELTSLNPSRQVLVKPRFDFETIFNIVQLMINIKYFTTSVKLFND